MAGIEVEDRVLIRCLDCGVDITAKATRFPVTKRCLDCSEKRHKMGKYARKSKYAP